MFVSPRSPVLAPVSGVNSRLTLHNWSRIPAPCPHTWARPNCQQQCLRLSQEPRRAPNCLLTTVCRVHCLLLIHNGFWVAELAELPSEQLSNDTMTRLTTLLLESEKWLLKGRDQFNITLLLATSRDNSTLRSELWNEGSIVRCSGQWCGGNGDSYPQIFGSVWIHFRYLQYWPWTMGSEPPPRTGTWLLTNGIIIVACVVRVPNIRYTNLIKVPSHILIAKNHLIKFMIVLSRRFS